MNYSYNPFIYCWLNSTFRNEAKHLFSYFFKCDQRQVNNTSESRRRLSSNEIDTKIDTVVMADKKSSKVPQELEDNFRDNTVVNVIEEEEDV